MTLAIMKAQISLSSSCCNPGSQLGLKTFDFMEYALSAAETENTSLLSGMAIVTTRLRAWELQDT